MALLAGLEEMEQMGRKAKEYEYTYLHLVFVSVLNICLEVFV